MISPNTPALLFALPNQLGQPEGSSFYIYKSTHTTVKSVYGASTLTGKSIISHIIRTINAEWKAPLKALLCHWDIDEKCEARWYPPKAIAACYILVRIDLIILN